MAFAATPAKAVTMSQSQINAVRQLADYFASIKSMKGEFTQIGPRGRVSNGVFYIVKPGKMRFEYAAPNPFLVVSDGTWVTIKNRARNKADQYPLSTTPLRLILEDNVNLFREAVIRSVKQSDEIATITLKDTNKFVSGSLILVFDQKQNKLQQWIVVDGRGRKTVVSFSQVKRNIKADPRLFAVKIPKRKPLNDNR